jgi:hypothetical protein
MVLVMAKNEQPMFQDFLGLDCGVTSKQQRQQVEECYTSATTTTTSRNIVGLISKVTLGPLEACKK